MTQDQTTKPTCPACKGSGVCSFIMITDVVCLCCMGSGIATDERVATYTKALELLAARGQS